MKNEDTIGGRPIFSERASASSIQRMRALLQDTWPNLGPSERRPGEDGETVHVFSAREGVEVRLGTWNETDVQVSVQILLAGAYVAVDDLGQLVHALGKCWQWGAEEDDGRWRLQVTAEVGPEQLGGMQEVVFRGQLERLRAWVNNLFPASVGDFDEEVERRKYGKLAEVLAPVCPWRCGGDVGGLLAGWASDVAERVSSGVSVGVPAETPTEQGLAAAVLAETLLRNGGRTLGQVTRASLDAQGLAQVVVKAPGVVAVAARILPVASNPYQLGTEVQGLLASLSASGDAAVFVGTYSELQQVFHGGQGVVNDPLLPAVCRLPQVPLAVLIDFAVHRACRKVDMGGAQFLDEVGRDVAKALAGVHQDRARRLVGPSTVHVVSEKLRSGSPKDCRPFIAKLSICSETFGGLSRTPRAQRSGALQRHLVDRLTAPELLTFFQERLLGQDQALEELCLKLAKETMTRPSHQPLRFASLGEPATGKSRSLELLAEWLDIPYVNIDVASLPDPHMAMSQLLGSGTGFVGSDQAGRLERIARHHQGAVVEVSEMDHALPSVRAAVGDTFLQVAETGEAQSGRGYMFSCSNLLFGFTLNLPDGKDERMYQQMGFGHTPTRDEVRKDIRRELKKLASGAFWSRIGDPVLFAALTVDVHGEIVRRALQAAAKTGLERIGIADVEVAVSQATARRLLDEGEAVGVGFGARGLLNLAGTHAAQAVLDLIRGGRRPSGTSFELVLNADGGAVFREK
jgi:AAA domain (Cdc48 subfamily)